MDRAVIRALLFPLCTWVLYGFQPEGVRLPDMPNLGGVESQVAPQGFEVIACELPFESLDRSMAPNEVVGMDDLCLSVNGDEAARDVKRDSGSFLTADLDGCAGVVTAAIELVIHLLEPIRAVALDETRAVNRCRA